MSKRENRVFIQSELKRFYHPSQPVNNNLKMLDSVEEVRIKKELLK